jgi:hypothetical protein
MVLLIYWFSSVTFLGEDFISYVYKAKKLGIGWTFRYFLN